MTTTTQKLEVDDVGIGVLTFDRPSTNALDFQFFQDLCSLLPELRRLRALILRGKGRFFSAGLDLFAVMRYSENEASAFATAFDDGVTGLFALEIPVVAAINGHAIAGGAVLAATADMRILAQGDARLGLTEIQVGVPFPTSALEAVRFSCGGPRLAELLYQGRLYQGDDAVAVHLADRIVKEEDLLSVAHSIAAELAGRNPVAFAGIKTALRKQSIAAMAAARQSGMDPIWSLWRGEETRNAIQSYATKLKRK